MPSDTPFHLDIVNSGMVRVACVTRDHYQGLEGLGFQPMAYGEGRLWVRDHPGDDAGLAAVLGGLRDLGCAFSKVHETSQLFARLRAAGLIADPYQEIDWSAPGKWFITER